MRGIFDFLIPTKNSVVVMEVPVVMIITTFIRITAVKEDSFHC